MPDNHLLALPGHIPMRSSLRKFYYRLRNRAIDYSSSLRHNSNPFHSVMPTLNYRHKHRFNLNFNPFLKSIKLRQFLNFLTLKMSYLRSRRQSTTIWLKIDSILESKKFKTSLPPSLPFHDMQSSLPSSPCLLCLALSPPIQVLEMLLETD
jgi:hypothetical protein